MRIRILVATVSFFALSAPVWSAPPTSRPSSAPHTTLTFKTYQQLDGKSWGLAYLRLKKTLKAPTPLLTRALNTLGIPARERLVRLLSHLAKTHPAFLPIVVQQLGANGKKVRTAAYWGLRKLGAKALPHLTKALRSKNWKTRSNAVLTLAYLGRKAQGIHKQIIALTPTSEWKELRSILFALSKLGVDTKETRKLIYTSLLHKKDTVCQNALLALVALKPLHSQAIIPLLKVRKRSNYRLRERALNVLSQYPTDVLQQAQHKLPKTYHVDLSKAIIKSIPFSKLSKHISLAQHPNAAVRAAFLKALKYRMYGKKLETFASTLVQGLQDSAASVRLAAIQSTPTYRLKHPALRTAVIQRHQDPSPEVREQAYRAILTYMSLPPKQYTSYAENGLRDPSARVRRIVIRSLRRKKSDLARLLRLQSLQDKDERVRLTALRVLQKEDIHSPKDFALMMAVLEKTTHKTNSSALHAITRMFPRHPDVLQAMLEGLESSDKQLQRTATYLLYRYPYSRLALPALRKAFTSKHNRLYAIQALMRIAPNNPDNLLLFNRALRDSDQSVRRAAIKLDTLRYIQSPILLYLIVNATLNTSTSVRHKALSHLSNKLTPSRLRPYLETLLKGLRPAYSATHKKLLDLIGWIGTDAASAVQVLFAYAHRLNSDEDLEDVGETMETLGPAAQTYLAARLKHGTLAEKQDAALLLQAFRWPVPHAIKALQQAAQSQDTQLSKSALSVLFNQHTQPKVLFAACLQALKRPDTSTRKEALTLLAKRFSSYTLPLDTLDILGLHTDLDIRQHVFKHLGRLYTQTSAKPEKRKIRSLLQDLVSSALTKGPYPLQEIALDALRTFASDLKTSLRTQLKDKLLKALHAPKTQPYRQLHILKALHTLGLPGTPHITLLTKLLSHKDPLVRSKAFLTWHRFSPNDRNLIATFNTHITNTTACSISKSVTTLLQSHYNKAVLPTLLKRYKGGDNACRESVIRVLTHPAFPLASTYPLLHSVLAGSSHVLKDLIITYFGQLKKTQKNAKVVTDINAALRTKRYGLRSNAARQLIKWRAFTSSWRAKIINLLQQGQLWSAAKEYAIKHLKQTPNVIQQLTKTYQTASSAEKMRLIDLATQLSDDTQQLLHFFQLVHIEHKGYKRTYGLKRLWQLARKHILFRPIIGGYLESPDAKLRRAVLSTAPHIKTDGRSFEPDLLPFLKKKEKRERTLALKALSAIGVYTKAGIKVMIQLLQQKKPQLHALYTLRHTTFAKDLPDSLQKALVQLTKTQETLTYYWALHAVAKRWKTKLAFLVPHIKDRLALLPSQLLKRYAIETLAMIMPAPEKEIDFFLQLHQRGTASIRNTILKIFQKMDKHIAPAMPIFLLDLLDPNSYIKHSALRALAKMGASASSALPLVRSLLRSTNHYTRREALKTLVTLEAATHPHLRKLLNREEGDILRTSLSMLATFGDKVPQAKQIFMQCSHSDKFSPETRTICKQALTKQPPKP